MTNNKCGYGCGRVWDEQGKENLGFDDCVSVYHIPKTKPNNNVESWAERFDRTVFHCDGAECDNEVLKSFIQKEIDTACSHQKEEIVKEIRDEVTKYVKEATQDPESGNYIYAEDIPLSRLSEIIEALTAKLK